MIARPRWKSGVICCDGRRRSAGTSVRLVTTTHSGWTTLPGRYCDENGDPIDEVSGLPDNIRISNGIVHIRRQDTAVENGQVIWKCRVCDRWQARTATEPSHPSTEPSS